MKLSSRWSHNRGGDPRQLAIDLLPRSVCSVKVASVIVDKFYYIVSYGWNHSGPTGMGQHAECHAILRANRNRLGLGTIYVAGQYLRGTLVNAKPCKECQKLIDKYYMSVVYRDKLGVWKSYV